MTNFTRTKKNGEVKLTEEESVRNMQAEVGSVGRPHSEIFGAALATEEYLQELRWPRDIQVYDKMRRSDSQIQCMLLAMELPIRSTKWVVEPYSEDSKDKQIAEEIEDNLFTGPPLGMSQHWEDFLRLAMTMIIFGHSVFEKVFKIDERGYARWKKFAQRPQRTIYDFLYDENGGPEMIRQMKVTGHSYEIVDIPIEKLLVFSHRMERGDLRGQSVLRHAYKHWMIKDFIYKVMNIGIERNQVGTPYIELPEEYGEQDYNRAREIVENLRSAEKGGAVIPPGFTLNLLESTRNMMDALPYIEHQDRMMLRGILAQFIDLGTGEVGSYALSKDQSDLFLMTLNATARYIAGVVNAYAIPQLVDFNWQVDGYPKVSFRPIGQDFSKVGEIITKLVEGQLVAPDENLEEWLRDIMELPEKSEDAPPAPRPEQDTPGEDEDDIPMSEIHKLDVSTPQQNRANYIVKRDGIKKRPCFICKSEQDVMMHHPDKNKPESVVFLCRSCHTNVENGTVKCPAPLSLSNLKNSEYHDHHDEDEEIHVHGNECGCLHHLEDRILARTFQDGQRRWRRDLTAWEKKLNLEELEERWDSEEEKLRDKGKEISDKQIQDLFDRVKKEVEAGNYDKLAKIPVRYRGEFSEFMGKQYRDLVEYGKREGARELGIDPDDVPTPNEQRRIADAQSGVVADNVAQRIKTRITMGILGALAGGSTIKQALYKGREDAKDIRDSELRTASSAQVGEAINKGRELSANKKGVNLAQFSGILDDYICPLCERLDGLIIELDNPDYDRFTPQLHHNCRCLWVYIDPEETPQPEPTWETPPASMIDQYGGLIFGEKGAGKFK